MTAIEWTDATWNPVRGCSVVSPGCTHCYAMKQAHRFSGAGQPYEGLTKLTKGGPVWTGDVRLVPEKLDEPLRWRKPRRVFVNSMSDLFHDAVPDEFIAAVWCAMENAHAFRGHTFQVLTKRADRMRQFVGLWRGHHREHLIDLAMLRYKVAPAPHDERTDGPCPGIWLGVSVEDQKRADERIPLLLQTPAAVRFLSVEPLLGSVSFPLRCKASAFWSGIQWVIVGGESGPRARPCDVSWIRSIVEQCKAASVPCFVKQLGARPWLTDSALKGWPPHVYCDDESIDRIILRSRKGGDPGEWPEDLRVRAWPR